jgi:hypothetical protein
VKFRARTTERCPIKHQEIPDVITITRNPFTYAIEVIHRDFHNEHARENCKETRRKNLLQ